MKKQKGEIIIALMFLFIVGISAVAATNNAELQQAQSVKSK